ncbi:MAG: hypothetical protein ACI9TB_002301, partial [Parasphingorhabdus sp.]
MTGMDYAQTQDFGCRPHLRATPAVGRRLALAL